jgi:dCMP deaminase
MTKKIEGRISLAEMYIDIAQTISKRSTCKRKQVGAVVVKDSSISAYGYNGTPHGWDNCCEDSENETKSEVIHAEINAITKMAKSNASIDGSTVYITLSPCFDCAKAIIQSGITTVIYLEEYRDVDPLQFLAEAGVEVRQVDAKGRIIKVWTKGKEPIKISQGK